MLSQKSRLGICISDISCVNDIKITAESVLYGKKFGKC